MIAVMSFTVALHEDIAPRIDLHISLVDDAEPVTVHGGDGLNIGDGNDHDRDSDPASAEAVTSYLPRHRRGNDVTSPPAPQRQ